MYTAIISFTSFLSKKPKENLEVRLEDICGKIRKPGLQIKDGKIIAEIELLENTPKGEIVKKLTDIDFKLYGDIAIEAICNDKEGPRSSDYKSFHFCILTGNPGITSKQKCPVKRYDIPVIEKGDGFNIVESGPKESDLVIDGAQITKKGNLQIKYFPQGSIVKVIGNVPTKGKIGQVDSVTNFGVSSYEIIDENGTNFFVVGTENLEEYKGFFERKDKYGDNPLAEPAKLDVVGTISRKVNEARRKL